MRTFALVRMKKERLFWSGVYRVVLDMCWSGPNQALASLVSVSLLIPGALPRLTLFLSFSYTQQVYMAMNQSGTLTLVRRYAIDHHQRDSKLRTYFESLVGEDGDGPEQSRLLSEELPQLVIVHERDMRAQNKRYLSKRGILQQATLEHVYAADEEHPAREERAQFLRRFSATKA